MDGFQAGTFVGGKSCLHQFLSALVAPRSPLALLLIQRRRSHFRATTSAPLRYLLISLVYRDRGECRVGMCRGEVESEDISHLYFICYLVKATVDEPLLEHFYEYVYL